MFRGWVTGYEAAVSEARILLAGDCAMTVEFGRQVDPQIHALALGFSRALDEMSDGGHLAGVIEWAPAFGSVTVYYDPEQISQESLAGILLDVARKRATASAAGLRWRIPACFDPDFAPDLEELADAKKITPETLITLMTQPVYRVYMLGFLPGFPYLGGLPATLEMPRLATPRPAVPAGSIAITGRMCAVYPWQSPGGWRLLGRTPVQMFEVSDKRRPALLAAGDEVQWYSIDRAAYGEIEAQVRHGVFEVSALLASENAG
jgi:KipI family sensor histidine kinase inhibitor